MKKIIILSFASILMLTGCGATDTLSCSFENNANNGTTAVTYDIDHEGNEVKKVRITYDYDFNNGNNDGNDLAAYNQDDNTDNITTNDTTNANNNANNANDTRNIDGNNTNGNVNDATNGNNDTNTNNDNITTYNTDGNTNNDTNNQIDGVGTGTDGTTNDSNVDNDGVVDGIVGSAIDVIVGGVTGIILDSAGLRDRHATVQNTYGNVNGFSVQNTTDTDDNYMVTYVIDFDTISDDDLANLNFSRDLDAMRDTYVNQGFTCK